jgi:hypothetical protein
LEELMIGNTEVSDAGLMRLEKLPNLRALWLGDKLNTTAAGMTALQAALPHCRIYQ